jgi:outer membrane protein assembly factor BamD
MASQPSFQIVFSFFRSMFIVGCLAAILAGCDPSEKPYLEKPLGTLYESGVEKLKKEDFQEAADDFDEVERQYPYSFWAAKAQLMSAYASFKAQNFLRAIGTLDIFLTLHPSSPYAAYAYYFRALSYYTDMVSPHRDKENAELAMEAFEEVCRRFPNTDYAQDAALKIDFLKEHLASQEILMIRFCMKRKDYVAAFQRLGQMITDFPSSRLIPEALYRLLECHVNLGLSNVAHKTFALLSYNFPKDSWTALARDLCPTSIAPPTGSAQKKQIQGQKQGKIPGQRVKNQAKGQAQVRIKGQPIFASKARPARIHGKNTR